MNCIPVAQTFLSAGSWDILVPCSKDWGLESPQNPAMRDWKACATSWLMGARRVLIRRIRSPHGWEKGVENSGELHPVRDQVELCDGKK
jgi:hypothetical protein